MKVSLSASATLSQERPLPSVSDHARLPQKMDAIRKQPSEQAQVYTLRNKRACTNPLRETLSLGLIFRTGDFLPSVG